MLIWICTNWPKLLGLTCLSSNLMDLPLDLMLYLKHNSSAPNLPQKVWTGPRIHFFKVSGKKRPPSLSGKYWTLSSHFLSGVRDGAGEQGPGHTFPGSGRHTCLSGSNLFEPCEAISSLSKSAQQPRTALLLLRLVVLNLLKLCSILSRRILPGRRLG